MILLGEVHHGGGAGFVSGFKSHTLPVSPFRFQLKTGALSLPLQGPRLPPATPPYHSEERLLPSTSCLGPGVYHSDRKGTLKPFSFQRTALELEFREEKARVGRTERKDSVWGSISSSTCSGPVQFHFVHWFNEL